MYNCVLFDMDGTLVDSYEGIFHAYQWTLEALGRPFGGDCFVRRAIGAPLPWVFRELCGMDEGETARAVRQYRRYYKERGQRETKAYEGMGEALRQLRQAGRRLGVATLKKEAFAKEILERLGLLVYFDVVCGVDENDRETKADLIGRCLRQIGSRPEETVLVGDSVFDAVGAQEAGIACLAVTYGFGFQTAAERAHPAVCRIADTPADIVRLLAPAGGPGA